MKSKKTSEEFDSVIDQIAKLYSISKLNCEEDMQEVIDMMWQSGDEKSKAKRDKLFPNGKPNVEEFVRTIADESNKCSE